MAETRRKAILTSADLVDKLAYRATMIRSRRGAFHHPLPVTRQPIDEPFPSSLSAFAYAALRIG